MFIATCVIVASTVAGMLLTTGRALGAAENVVARIDETGTRTVTFRPGKDENALNGALVSRLGAFDHVVSIVGFGPAEDVRNANFLGGERLAARPMVIYGNNPAWSFPLGDEWRGQSVLVSKQAMMKLGLESPYGAVVGADSGVTYSVAGSFSTPDFLASYEPLVVVSGVDEPDNLSLASLVILIDDPVQVEAVTDAALEVIGPSEPGAVTIESGSDLVALRESIQRDLGEANGRLVVGLLSGLVILNGAVGYVNVSLRRREIARRRALGASMRFVSGLLLSELACAALVGIAAGFLLSLGALLVADSPLPGPRFIASLAWLILAASLVAGVVPTCVALRREPASELRVP